MRSLSCNFRRICIQASTSLGIALLAVTSSGCSIWLDPLADTPENLELAVFTVGLRKDANSRTPVTPEGAAKMIQGASDFWKAKCGISFRNVGHFERNAEADGAPTIADGNADIRDLQFRYSHSNYISAVFTNGITLDFGHDDSTIGGLAVYPWAFDRRAILMVGPYDGIFSHELGHYMGLTHVEDNGFNLMFPADIVSHEKHVLSGDQCAEAKRYVLGHSMLREICRPSSPDPELSKTNCPKIDF